MGFFSHLCGVDWRAKETSVGIIFRKFQASELSSPVCDMTSGVIAFWALMGTDLKIKSGSVVTLEPVSSAGPSPLCDGGWKQTRVSDPASCRLGHTARRRVSGFGCRPHGMLGLITSVLSWEELLIHTPMNAQHTPTPGPNNDRIITNETSFWVFDFFSFSRRATSENIPLSPNYVTESTAYSTLRLTACRDRNRWLPLS